MEGALLSARRGPYPMPNPMPDPPSQLVKVRAAGINPVDYKLPGIPLVGRQVRGKPVGLDFSGTATAYALRKSGAVGFCHADGAELGWIPDGAFDHAVSFGALYHLWINGTGAPARHRLADHPAPCNVLGYPQDPV